MELTKSKPLSPLIFIPLLALIFIRPFISGLAYPTLELYYENLVIFLAIAALFFSTRSKNKEPRESKRNPYHLPILVLLSAYILSTIFSSDIQNSIKETIKLISYLSLFFIVTQTTEKQKGVLIKTLAVSALIICLYSIYQYLWGFQNTLDHIRKWDPEFLSSTYAQDILIGKRSIGTFPSPNIFAGYLSMIIFFAVYLIHEHHRASRRISKNPGLLLPIIIIPVFFLTKSMGALLSLGLAILILFLTSRLVRQKKSLIIMSSILIIIAMTFILFTRGDRFLDSENPQNSITQRLNYWRTAIAIIRDNPVLGVGPGNFQKVFLKYKPAPGTNTRYAHNIFLQIWSEIGIFGVIGILYLIIIFIKKNLFQFDKRILFFAGLVFILHNLIDNTYFIPQAGFVWWVLLGLL